MEGREILLFVNIHLKASSLGSGTSWRESFRWSSRSKNYPHTSSVQHRPKANIVRSGSSKPYILPHPHFATGRTCQRHLAGCAKFWVLTGFLVRLRPSQGIPTSSHTHSHPHNQDKYRRLNPVERNQILHLTVRCVRQESHERVWESFGARWRWHKSISFRACTETQPYDPGAVKCLYRMGWSYQK